MATITGLDDFVAGIEHAVPVSDKPWSSFKQSDYSDAQWLRACLLVRSEGSPKERGSCPVREPDGTLNKGGMAAAAAVLGSSGGSGNARGNSLSASDSQKASARNKLVRLYKAAGLETPSSLEHSDLALEHHGILGMRWGVRRPVNSSGLVVKTGGSSGPGGSGGRAGGSQEKSSADHERATSALSKASTHGRSSLSNEELNALTKRIEAEKKFVQLTTGEKSALQKQVDQMRLESDYRRLRAESTQARKSAGRKLVESLLRAASDAAVKQASSYGDDLVKEMLGVKTRDLKGEINSMKLKKEHYDLSAEVRKRGISAPPTVRTHSPVGTPFKVNPSKVRFTKINNLPNLKPTGP